MCTMKEACERVGMSYDTLKFYCKEGLVPNVKRDKNNYRDFDEDNIVWLQSLQCLKQSGMGIKELKHFLNLCLEGKSTLPQRQEILKKQKEVMLQKRKEIDETVSYIEHKMEFYDDLMEGKLEYVNKLSKTNA